MATIAEATDIAGKLRKLLTQNESVLIDLNEITKVDFSFIQLLLSLAATAKASKQEFLLTPLPAQHPLRIIADLSGNLPVKNSDKITWFGLTLAKEEREQK